MRPLRNLTTFTALAVSITILAGDASGQGLLRRLKSRIAPILAEQLDDQAEKNPLPKRPTEPDANPTPAVGPSGVRQAGALDETIEPKPAPQDRAGQFGRSILTPLDTEDNQAVQPAGGGSEVSIGIKGVEANPGYPAVQVTEIAAHSRAHRDGLRVGDYIFAIDGVPTPSIRVLVDQVNEHAPGDRVRLRVGRAGQVSDIDITLVGKATQRSAPTAMPSAQSGATRLTNPLVQSPALTQTTAPPQTSVTPQIGASVRDVRGRRGVEVIAVEPRSLAAASGLKKGDRIVAIDGKMVSDTPSFTNLLTQKASSESAVVQIIRDNQLASATLNFAADTAAESDAADISGDKADAAESETASPGGGGSLVSGLGSVLGGMFSQKPSESKTPETDIAAANVDPLALDAELLPSKNDAAVDSNPPVDSTKSGDSKALRDEIARLRDQLKKLESRLDE